MLDVEWGDKTDVFHSRFRISSGASVRLFAHLQSMIDVPDRSSSSLVFGASSQVCNTNLAAGDLETLKQQQGQVPINPRYPLLDAARMTV